MATQAMGHDLDPIQRKGVRRTLWIAGGLAVGFFLLSILSMLTIGK